MLVSTWTSSLRWIWAAGALFCSFALSAVSEQSTIAFAEEPTEFRVCLLEDDLPFSSRQEESGFDLDTAKAVAEKLTRTFVPVWTKNDTKILEIEESDFPLRRLGRGECDAIFSIPGMDAIKGSPKVTIGAPYYGAAFELIGKADATPQNLTAVGDLPVAVQAQTVANFVLNASKCKMLTFFATDAALEAVSKGEAPAAFLWGPAAGWYLSRHPDQQLTFSSAEPLTAARWNEHVATRKSDEELRVAIDGALAQLSEAGMLATLTKRYGIPFHRPFSTTYSFAEVEKLKR